MTLMGTKSREKNGDEMDAIHYAIGAIEMDSEKLEFLGLQRLGFYYMRKLIVGGIWVALLE